MFPWDGQRELFAAIGSADKELVAFPGRHAHTPPEAAAAWTSYLIDRLLPTT